MGARKLAKNRNRRNGAEDSSGKWDNDDQGLQMRGGEKAPLSPVSEAPDEDEDEGLVMYDIRDAGVPAVPDGGYGWVIVLASFFCNLIVDGIAYTFGVFLPKFVEAFNEGKGKVAWAGSLLCGVYLCVGPIVSALANKYGCRSVCIVGAVVGAAGFALSALSPNLQVLMLTYGVIGGVGFGLVYLPAVVCVGYYFESKRALATGIAVCGSGVGTFIFAPFASWLLEVMDWRGANLVFSGLILSCGLFGILMKPLEVQVLVYDEDEEEEDVERGAGGHRPKPLLQRMAEDKKHYMERGSLAGSAYFMVQLPDGTMERRQKMPINVDPGVHSSFNLDQLVSGTCLTPVPTMPVLPTITEAKTTETGSSSEGSREGSVDPEKKKEDSSNANTTEDNNNPLPNIPEPIEEEKESEAGTPSDSSKDLPMSTSIPIPKKNNYRERRNSEGVQSSSPSSNQTTPVSSVKQDAAALLLSKSPSKPTMMPARVGSTVGSQLNKSSIPRNGSAPQFRSIPKNTSVPLFDKHQATRRPSFRAVPLGTSASKGSKVNLQAVAQPDSRRGSITNTIKGSIASFMGSKIINQATQEDGDSNSLWSKAELSDGLIFSSSQKSSTQAEPRHIIRPMSRKDIFYSGSIINLPEYKSQMSINSYRQSVLNIPRESSVLELDGYGGGYQKQMQEKPDSVCPCLGRGAGAFKSALAQLMDFSLLANPVFLFIAISNVFGMLGFYVPFVYLIDAAVLKGVSKDLAAFLLSIIGVTNTLGRVLSGMVSDLPQVNSLFMNNVCILLSGLCVLAVPFCGSSYYAYVTVAVFFGLFVSAYISLTSIILVDLLGLENLTNAFGLLILFRGAAGIIGAPLAGAVFDEFKSYDISFFLAGGFLIIAAIISFLVPLVTRCAPEKPILQPPIQPGGYLEDIPEGAESNTNSGDLEEEDEGEEGEGRGEKFDQVESCL